MKKIERNIHNGGGGGYSGLNNCNLTDYFDCKNRKTKQSSYKNCNLHPSDDDPTDSECKEICEQEIKSICTETGSSSRAEFETKCYKAKYHTKSSTARICLWLFLIMVAFSLNILLISFTNRTNSNDLFNTNVIGLSGTGSASNPYLINSETDLKSFATNISNGTTYYEKYVRLCADISIYDSSWSGIGTTQYSFAGTFDGNGHDINFSCSVSSGVFNCISSCATIKNLGVVYSSVSGFSEGVFSSITIHSWGGITNFICNINNSDIGKIEECFVVYLGVNLTTETGVTERIEFSFGGIVGYDVSGKVIIENCYAWYGESNYITIEGYPSNEFRMGGICGYGCNAILNCYMSGSITLADSECFTGFYGSIWGGDEEVTIDCFYIGGFEIDSGTTSLKLNSDDVSSKVSNQKELFTSAKSAGWDFSSTWIYGYSGEYGPLCLRVFNYEEDLSEISSEEQLAKFKDRIGGGYTYSGETVTLINDITVLDTSWSGIGTTTYGFQGTFDGSGHIITFTSAKSGLFANVSTGATIKDLGIKGTIVSNGSGISVGGIVNTTPTGTNLYTIKIQNCFNTANITLTSGNGYIGGIIGCAVSGTTISNCYNSGTIKTNYASISTFIGGIVGSITGSRGNPTIENCYDCSAGSTGGLSANTNTKIGAITGASMTITKCFYVNAPTNGEIRTQTGLTRATSADDLTTKAKNAGWSFTANTGTWETVKGQNGGYPVLQIFNFQSFVSDLTINASVSSGNSMLLLTIVDNANKVVREIGYFSGQKNIKTTISLDGNTTYYMLVTKPFGSNFSVSQSGSGLTITQSSGSTTKYILETKTGTSTLTIGLTGSGEWKNAVVI